MLLREQLIGKDNKEKLLTEEQFAKQRDINFFIKYGFDRKKRHGKEGTNSTESTSEKGKFDDDFINEEEEGISPKVEPQPLPNKVEEEELEQEIGARNVSRTHNYRQLALLLSNVTLIKNNLVFIQSYIQNGGIYFFIPYFIMLFVFAVPMAIFELSIAQFSSVPLFALFKRMNPVLGGISFLIIITRIIYTINLFEPRYMTFAIQSLSSVLADSHHWTKCNYSNDFLCFDPMLQCHIQQYQYNGTCYPALGFNELRKLHPVVVAKYFSRLESRMISLIPSQIFESSQSLDQLSKILAAFLTLLISAFISYRGHRFFSNCATLFLVLPFFGLLPVAILSFIDNSSNHGKFNTVVNQFNHFPSLFELNTWIVAARVCVKTVNIADGTLLTLGSRVDFRHNFFKDALLMAAAGATYRIISCFAIFPILFAGNELVSSFAGSMFSNKEDSSPSYSQDLFFVALPSFEMAEIGAIAKFGSLAAFYSTANLAYFTFQVITFEMLSAFIYTIFPRLLYKNMKIVKICISIFSVSLLFVLKILSLKNSQKDINSIELEINGDKYLMGLLAACSFYQLFSINFSHGYQRLIVNTMTMLKSHKKTFKIFFNLRIFFYVMWMFFLPLLCFITVYKTLSEVVKVLNSSAFIFTLITCLPIFYATWKIVKSTLQNRLDHIASNARWDPTNSGNARQAEYDARARGLLH